MKSRTSIVGVFLLLVVISLSQAAILVTTDIGVATPNKPGFRTYTVSVQSTVANEQIQGVDFAGDGSNNPSTGKGFFGTMAQLGPPTINTVYQDNNSLIPLFNPGHTAAEDSQFLINSGAANIGHPNGLDEESDTILQGIWAWTEPQGLGPIPFAQLVLPFGGTVGFRGSFALNTPGGIIDTPVIASPAIPCCFESPLIAVDVDLGNVPRGTFINHQFTVSSSAGDVTWSNLVTHAPGVPALPPTLNPNGFFTWSSTGSPLGTYTFDATVTDLFGPAVGHLTLRLVPEPCSLAIVGWAIVAQVIVSTRARARRHP
jgi:hypothetical protein